jgi:hypothetical protein
MKILNSDKFRKDNYTFTPIFGKLSLFHLLSDRSILNNEKRPLTLLLAYKMINHMFHIQENYIDIEFNIAILVRTCKNNSCSFNWFDFISPV